MYKPTNFNKVPSYYETNKKEPEKKKIRRHEAKPIKDNDTEVQVNRKEDTTD